MLLVAAVLSLPYQHCCATTTADYCCTVTIGSVIAADHCCTITDVLSLLLITAAL